jgi:tetratricopeptide (TPR) repeat protein
MKFSGTAVITVMLKRYLILFFCLSFILSGCASMSSQSGQSVVVQVDEVAPELKHLPNVDLDGDILFRLLTADLAIQRQQFGLAASLYLIVAKETHDPRLAEQAARLALFTRLDREALEASRLWVERVPESLAAREAIISAYIRNGDTVAVQEHLDYMLAIDGEQTELLSQLVTAMTQHNSKQDVHTAYLAVKNLADRHANDPIALFALAYIAMNSGELREAQAAIEATLKLRPHWLKAMNNYALILRMQGNVYESAIYLAGVVKAYPDAIDVRTNYARLLVETRQLDEALEQYLWIIDKYPQNEDSLFVAALLSLQLNVLDQANDLLHRLVAMGRRLDVTHFYLGQIADLRNESDVAIEHYTEVTGGEHLADAQLRVAALLAERGDILLARTHLDKLRQRRSPQLNRIDVVEARILEEDGQLDEAMKIYANALQRDPEDRDLLFNQALLADRMGRFDLIEHNLTRVLEKDPDDVNALNALGFAMTNHTTRYSEAYAYLQKAIDLRPHSGAILDSVGWVLYRLGRLDEALDYLNRSLEITQDQEVYAHLGEVLWMRGDHDAAREIWGQALERVPDDKYILDVMKRFGQ